MTCTERDVLDESLAVVQVAASAVRSLEDNLVEIFVMRFSIRAVRCISMFPQKRAAIDDIEVVDERPSVTCWKFVPLERSTSKALGPESRGNVSRTTCGFACLVVVVARVAKDEATRTSQ